MKRLLFLLVIVCIFFSSYSSQKKSIVVENNKYLEGDNQMTEEERFTAFMKEYSTACRELRKYIII